MKINPTKISSQNLILLHQIISRWYSENKEPNPKTLAFIKSIDYNHTWEEPKTLYRGFSFDNPQTKNQIIKDIKNRTLKHPTKKIESWTSSLAIAKTYATGPDTNTLLISIPFSDVKDHILFSIEYLFTGKNDTRGIKQKQQFFKMQVNNQMSLLLKDIKNKNYKPGQFSDTLKGLEIFIPGLVRALTEFEYIIPTIIPKENRNIQILDI